MKKIFAVLAAMLLLTIMACGSSGGGGGSSSNTPAERSAIQGTWGNGTSNITFMEDNTYTVDTNHNDVADAWGTYSTTGNQLTMTDSGGTSSCFNTTSQTFDTGHYIYSISGNTLNLTLVSDSCSGRTTTLSDSLWTGQSTSDTTAPSIPTNLSATAATTSQINLNWSAASDNIGVAGYKVFRGSSLITTTVGTVFSDTGLASNTTYSYTVSAYDAAGNDSGKSAPASATTLTSTTPTYSISGTVSGDEFPVTITLSGAYSASTTTDTSGNYSFTGLADGNYTVKPSYIEDDYTFSPSSTAVNISGANVTNINFTENWSVTNPNPTYTISGKVSGSVLSGVTITLSRAGAGSASTTTNSSGNYSFYSIAPGSYTLTPSKSGYLFSPTSTSVTVSNANVTGQNFTATATAAYTTADLNGTWTGTVTATGTSQGDVSLQFIVTFNSNGMCTGFVIVNGPANLTLISGGLNVASNGAISGTIRTTHDSICCGVETTLWNWGGSYLVTSTQMNVSFVAQWSNPGGGGSGSYFATGTLHRQ